MYTNKIKRHYISLDWFFGSFNTREIDEYLNKKYESIKKT